MNDVAFGTLTVTELAVWVNVLPETVTDHAAPAGMPDSVMVTAIVGATFTVATSRYDWTVE
jgi:hypothetical protein